MSLIDFLLVEARNAERQRANQRERVKATEFADANNDVLQFLHSLGIDMSQPQDQALSTPQDVGNAVSAVETRAALRGIRLTGAQQQKLQQYLSHVNIDDFTDQEIKNDAALVDKQALKQDTPTVRPVPVTPKNLPAVIHSTMTRTEVDPKNAKIHLHWHMVKNLPGYMQQPIRMLGRQIFSAFTNTPIEEIQVLAHMNGKGPNTRSEMNAIASWLMRNAVKDLAITAKLEKMFPGYDADIKVYNSEGITFICVKDFMGVYVYAFPGGRGVQVTGPKSRTRLAAPSRRQRRLK